MNGGNNQDQDQDQGKSLVSPFTLQKDQDQDQDQDQVQDQDQDRASEKKKKAEKRALPIAILRTPPPPNHGSGPGANSTPIGPVSSTPTLSTVDMLVPDQGLIQKRHPGQGYNPYLGLPPPDVPSGPGIPGYPRENFTSARSPSTAERASIKIQNQDLDVPDVSEIRRLNLETRMSEVDAMNPNPKP